MSIVKFSEIFIAIFFGLNTALFLFIIMELPTIWCVLSIIGMIIPFIAIISGDIKRFFLAILVLSLTIQLDIAINNTIHSGGPPGFIISLYDIALLALYMLWISEIVGRKNIEVKFFSNISYPTFCLIILSLLSMINAPFITLSLFEIKEIIKMFLGFFYIANNIKKKRDIRFIIIFLFLGIFLESLLGIFQYFSDHSFGLKILGENPELLKQKFGSMEISRVSGTFGHPNTFGWYLNFMLPLLIGILFFEKRKIFRVLYILILFFGTIALIFTLSRASWVSFLIGIIVVISISFWKITIKHKLKAAISIILIITTITIVILIFSDIISRRLYYDDYGSARFRIPLMKEAFSIIKSHPILGVGINNYTEVIRDNDHTISRISYYPVHNIYLYIAAEIGILGVFIFILIIFRFYKYSIYYIRSENGLLVGMVIGMLGGITGFLIHGMVDDTYLGSFLFIILWFFVGILIAIKNINSG